MTIYLSTYWLQLHFWSLSFSQLYNKNGRRRASPSAPSTVSALRLSTTFSACRGKGSSDNTWRASGTNPGWSVSPLVSTRKTTERFPQNEDITWCWQKRVQYIAPYEDFRQPIPESTQSFLVSAAFKGNKKTGAGFTTPLWIICPSQLGNHLPSGSGWKFKTNQNLPTLPPTIMV